MENAMDDYIDDDERMILDTMMEEALWEDARTEVLTSEFVRMMSKHGIKTVLRAAQAALHGSYRGFDDRSRLLEALDRFRRGSSPEITEDMEAAILPEDLQELVGSILGLLSPIPNVDGVCSYKEPIIHSCEPCEIPSVLALAVARMRAYKKREGHFPPAPAEPTAESQFQAFQAMSQRMASSSPSSGQELGRWLRREKAELEGEPNG